MDADNTGFAHEDNYAHTLAGEKPELWQTLTEHLLAVSQLAERFAAAFDAGIWGRKAGLWHDIGKYSREFQSYLLHANLGDHHLGEIRGRVDHSTAGARFAAESIPVFGGLLAYAVAGHHAGLPNGIDQASGLEQRLQKHVDEWKSLLPSHLKMEEDANLTLPPRHEGNWDAFSIAFFTRMLYSCLVDADFLDTEAFMNPQQASVRGYDTKDVLHRMHDTLHSYLNRFAAPSTRVNCMRQEVLQACVSASMRDQGFFSLTVPTGGGKTLSSLAFALRHAVHHDLDRIIYIIPFTSIIEQNASVFRKVFTDLVEELGFDPVLEHHSNFDVEKETARTRLATENWDAPLIVTTAVQFYESLFANRSSKCRKLHNIARSVIILDEAQSLPVQYLEPCLRALRELTEQYRSTVVLCTATQPAVTRRDQFPIGISGVREIIRDTGSLFENLKRVALHDIGKVTDVDLSHRLREHTQALCIVNTRRHARTLHESLGQEEAHIHLSALMCPAHRSQILADVRQRLLHGKPCRLVATRLIEAGVDIDFPVVYRSLTGIDSLAQAAGRCNRNGVLGRDGKVYVFRSEHEAAERFVRETANVASQIMNMYSDPLNLQAVEHYFRLYFWDKKSQWDEKRIMQCFKLDRGNPQLPFLFQFRTVNDSFRLIEDSGRSVIVPWEKKGEALCEKLRGSFQPDRAMIRKLQRFTVQIPKRWWDTEVNRSIEIVHDRFAILINPKIHYSKTYGVSLDGTGDTMII